MIYSIDGDHLKPATVRQAAADSEQSYVGVMNYEELAQNGAKLGIKKKFIDDCLRGGVTKHECYDGFDFLSLHIPDDSDQRKPTHRVCMYLSARLLVFVCLDNDVINNMMAELEESGLKGLCIARILHLFLDRLTFDDAEVLEAIEQNIAQLEEELITSEKNDFTSSINVLRRKLFCLKRYYEELIEIAEHIEENENEFIDEKTMRYFKMITGRVDRLYHDVLNLRDYVTQVREAYQAQIDIDLNSVMKLFTVITSVFLPLTLIVGWYGMNVKMPEYGWNFGYVFVIGISIVVFGITMFFFKRKRWF